MFTIAPAIAEKNLHQEMPASYDYYSVEFGINGSHPVYQFKLWHSERLPHFFLLKESSALAAQLKTGDVILMKYYCNDPARSIEHHETRIDAIVNETSGRFAGHFRIKVTILETAMDVPWQPTGTDN